MQSPEAVRSGKYAKYLNRFRFNTFVLTSERKDAGIFRRALAHYDIIPDACGKWIKPAFKEACEIIEKQNIDIIVSRSMPIVSHRVALLVKEKYPNIPWIAEFSDPWTQSTYKKYKIGFGKNRDEKYEESIFNKADKIIATSYRTAELFSTKYPDASIEPIPNFYDEEEFMNIQESFRIPNKFVIMCTGNFYGIRTPEYLFKALKELEKENVKDILVMLVGNLGKYQKLVDKYNISGELLQIIPPVGRDKAIELLKYADAYLLVDAPSKEPSVFLPSKLPEYLYMRKPILALTSTGTVEDIINETRTGLCILPEEVSKIKIALTSLPRLRINLDADITQYGAMECVWDLALIIKELINKKGDVKDNQCLRGETKLSKDSPLDEGL
jgi:glycosyltransferase involved in cell wall biosynthesis